jgi:peptidoglycan/LPS O-acetylase OafA/YrhL
LAEDRSPPPLTPEERADSVHGTADPRVHYVELDALRGIAILGVVATHTAGFWGRMTRTQLDLPLLNVNLLDFFHMGYLGVSLFFLLSGYLLTWTEGKRAREGSYSLLSYAKRRALRLVPAYYAAILLVVVVWPTSPTFADVSSLFTFLHGFKLPYPRGLDPAWWSLTPEVIFYLMLPLLVLVLRRTWQRVAVLALLLAVSLGTRLLMASGAVETLPVVGEHLAGNRLYFFPTTLLYLFIVGMLLRTAVERAGEAGSSFRWRRPAASTLGISCVALLAVFPYAIAGPGFLRSPLGLIAEGLVVLLFVSVLMGSPVLKPVLAWRPLAFVGEISYSLFLLHTTVIFLTSRYVLFGARPWFAAQGEAVVWAAFAVYAAFVLVAGIALSYLSYRFIESPFLRRKPG